MRPRSQPTLASPHTNTETCSASRFSSPSLIKETKSKFQCPGSDKDVIRKRQLQPHILYIIVFTKISFQGFNSLDGSFLSSSLKKIDLSEIGGIYEHFIVNFFLFNFRKSCLGLETVLLTQLNGNIYCKETVYKV